MTKQTRISKAELLTQIHLSKVNFCSFTDPEYAQPDLYAEHVDAITVAFLEEANIESGVVRVFTYEHIPTLDQPRFVRGRVDAEAHKHEALNFRPFKHYLAKVANDAVVLEEVGRSHWVGGLQNGHFSANHGRLTEQLGKLLMVLADRYSRAANFSGYSYRDEMALTATAHLCAVALKYDESQKTSPFAFFTTCANHVFLRFLKVEKQVQELRDDLIEMAGSTPSQTRQDQEYLKRFEPVKLERKRGRKSAAHIAGQRTDRT